MLTLWILGEGSQLIVSPTCHMEQCIDIVQLDGRYVQEDHDPKVLESAAECFFGLVLSKFAHLCDISTRDVASNYEMFAVP